MNCANQTAKGRSANLPKRGGDAMEVFQAISLMIMFGMFIITLLNYLKKK